MKNISTICLVSPYSSNPVDGPPCRDLLLSVTHTNLEKNDKIRPSHFPSRFDYGGPSPCHGNSLHTNAHPT